MQIVSLGDNLHECNILFSEKNKENISKCHLLKILPTVLSGKSSGCDCFTATMIYSLVCCELSYFCYIYSFRPLFCPYNSLPANVVYLNTNEK